MLLDFDTTNTNFWISDTYANLHLPNDAVIFEIHRKDITIQKE
jgi:hypothetical protein